MHDLNAASQNDIINMNTIEEVSHKSDAKLAGDLSDISFLDPVNPNLVAMSNQLENMRIGQTNILPGTLSQPMSVEEKVGGGFMVKYLQSLTMFFIYLFG